MNPAESLSKKEKEILIYLLSNDYYQTYLTKRNSEILSRYLEQIQTLQQTANEFNLSRDRIRQLVVHNLPPIIVSFLRKKDEIIRLYGEGSLPPENEKMLKALLSRIVPMRFIQNSVFGGMSDEEKAKLSQKPDQVSIHDIGLTPEILNILLAYDLGYLSDLISYTAHDLLLMRGIQKIRLAFIEQRLSELNLTLKPAHRSF